MDDRCIMENLLLTTKGVCDLYLHGTIESSTQDVRQSFDQALNFINSDLNRNPDLQNPLLLFSR